MSSQVWELDLPHQKKLVALAVADWANDDGYFFSKIDRIARKCQCSERTVQRIFEGFRKSGLVVPVVTTADGRKVTAAAAPKGGRWSAPEYKITPANSPTLPPIRTVPTVPIVPDPSQNDTRGDNLSPVSGVRGDTLSPVPVPHGVTNGAARGDKKGVSRNRIYIERKRSNVKEREVLGRTNRAQFDTNCEYVENPRNHVKPTQQPHRRVYAIVGTLADAAVDLWRAHAGQVDGYTPADLAADLKTHAAKTGQPYSADVIDRALTVANERAKNYRLTIF